MTLCELSVVDGNKLQKNHSDALNNLEKQTLEVKKMTKHIDFENMAYRFELTDDKFSTALSMKIFAASTFGYTLHPVILESSDIILMMESLFPSNVRVNVTIDDFRLRTVLTVNKTSIYTTKTVFYTIQRITDRLTYIPGRFKIGKPINITGND